MKSFFVFDVESVGLHGEGFAVGGGLFLENGSPQWTFRYACPVNTAKGDDASREWVAKNIPELGVTHRCPETMRDSFWREWERAKRDEALMAADCLWPVESNFIHQCIKDSPGRNGPYPFVEISSVLLAAGMDPIGTYDREPSEMPQHDPMADARQSARILAMALDKIGSMELTTPQLQ